MSCLVIGFGTGSAGPSVGLAAIGISIGGSAPGVGGGASTAALEGRAAFMAAADIVGSTVGRVPAGFGTVANGSWLAGIPIRLSLRAKLFIGYAVMLAVSIGGSAFGYRTAMRDREWNDAVARSANVIRHADAAMLTVSDMEARYAEYALTGSASARTAYRVDLNRARSQLTALSDLTGDQVAAGNLFDLSSMPLTRAV